MRGKKAMDKRERELSFVKIFAESFLTSVLSMISRLFLGLGREPTSSETKFR